MPAGGTLRWVCRRTGAGRPLRPPPPALRPPPPALPSLPVALPLEEPAVGGDFLLQVRFDAQKDLVFAVLPLQVVVQLYQFLLVVGDDLLHVPELAGVPRPGLR